MLKSRALSEREHLVNEHSGYGARLLNAMLTVFVTKETKRCAFVCFRTRIEGICGYATKLEVLPLTHRLSAN